MRSAAGNSRDVSLRITAKNEADRTIKSVADSLGLLDKAQDGAAASAAALQNQLSKAERSTAQNAKATKQITDAVETQAQKLLATNQAIAERRTRIDELTRALKLLEAESGKEFVGPSKFGDPSAVLAQIKTIKAELRGLDTSIGGRSGTAGLTGEFEKQLVKLHELRDAQRTLRSAQEQAESSVSALTARLREQNAELTKSSRESASQSFFNNKFAPGLNSTSNTAADREAIASVLRVAEARDVETQRIREQRAELARLTEARRIANSVASTTDSRGGKSAELSASVFAEVDAREAEARALKNSAAAHLQFEQRAKQGAQAMREAESAAKQEASELEHLRAVLNPAAAAEAKLAAETAKLQKFHRDGKLSADELRVSLKLLGDEANRTKGLDSGGRPSLFGLKPYELQNLSYQVNDVFTQLASGTSLAQTLGQQGGQILQLFPRVGSAIAAGLSSGPLIAFTAGLATLALGVKEAADEAEELRTFGSILSASADGARNSADGLRIANVELSRYGISAEQALAVTRVFLKDGLNDQQIVQFGRAAKDLSDVMGIDLVEAARELSSVVNGGYDAIKKLDEATNFLTATQREQIKALFEEGRASDARTMALDIFTNKMGTAADNARGPWSDAFRELGNTWKTFTEYLADTSWAQGISEAFDGMGRSAAKFWRDARGGRTVEDIKDDLRQIQQLQRDDASKGGNSAYLAQQKAVLDTELKLAQVRSSNGVGRGNAQAGGLSVGIGGAAAPGGISERQRKIDADLAAADEKRLAAAKALTNERRLQIAFDEALLEAQNKGASEAGARASATAARNIEQLKISKELEASAKAQAAAAREKANAEERSIKSFSQKVVGVESSGNRLATNSASSAVGLGQFIEGTWLKLFKENFPDRAEGMTNSMILALRTDAATSKAMIEIYARENSAVLKRAGQSVTEANLYLAHFLGSAGANKVLKAAPGTPIADILKPGAIKANPKILGNGATAGSVRAFAGRKFGETSAAEATVETRLDALAADRLEKQTKFNEKLDDENEKRRLATAALEAQSGLQGEALLAEQRKQTIAEAVLAKQQEIDKLNLDLVRTGQSPIEFTDAQRKAVEELTGAYFDAVNAKARFDAQRNVVDKPVQDLNVQRDALRAQIDSLRQNGLDAQADQLLPQLDAVNGKLREAIDNAIRLYQAMTPGTPAFPGTQAELDAIISKFQTLKLGAVEWTTLLGISGQQIAQTFASGITSAFDRFAQAIANGSNAFESLKNAFLSFASDFFRQIEQMIIQQTTFNLVSGLLKSVAGGFMGTGQSQASLDAGQIFHAGGIVGGPAPSRAVSPAWFRNAARYHTGGIAGLRPDEVPAVLQRGEEVLTASDPRHRNNGGGGAPVIQLKNVNVFDSAEVLDKALNSRVGEKVLLNYVRNNASAVRGAMGV